ncbi:rho GTPase-activating protein 18 isoform X1 [Tachysurus ichikawai]
MNRHQDARGVILTGYISNSQAAFSTVCAPAASSGDEPEAPGPRVQSETLAQIAGGLLKSDAPVIVRLSPGAAADVPYGCRGLIHRETQLRSNTVG